MTLRTGLVRAVVTAGRMSSIADRMRVLVARRGHSASMECAHAPSGLTVGTGAIPHGTPDESVGLRGWRGPATVGSPSNKIDSIRRRAVTATTALAVSEHGPCLRVQRNSVERERVRPDIGPSEARRPNV